MFTQANERALRSQFPTLYIELDKFDVPDSWYPLIQILSEKVQMEINKVPEQLRGNYRVIRCKSFADTLVFKMRESTEVMNEAIHVAQVRAGQQ